MRQLGNTKNYWNVSGTDVDMRRTTAEPKTVTVAAQPQRLTFDLNHTAMIVVDMQNDFCSKGGWVDYIGGNYAVLQNPIEPLNPLLPELRKADVPVISLNWGNRADRLNISPSVIHVYNVDGEGRGIGDPLPDNQSRVLEKGSWAQLSLTAYSLSRRTFMSINTALAAFGTRSSIASSNLNVHTVLFTGVNLDQCVIATLQDAVNSGYDAILLEHCSATNSPSFCTEATLYNIKQCYGFITESSLLIEAIQTKHI